MLAIRPRNPRLPFGQRMLTVRRLIDQHATAAPSLSKAEGWQESQTLQRLSCPISNIRATVANLPLGLDARLRQLLTASAAIAFPPDRRCAPCLPLTIEWALWR